MVFRRGATSTTTIHVGQFMPRPCRTGGGDAPPDDVLTPIEGVTIQLYATIVRGIANFNCDSSMLPCIAADHGVPNDMWPTVQQGWNARIRANPAVARRFSDVYHDAELHSTVP